MLTCVSKIWTILTWRQWFGFRLNFMDLATPKIVDHIERVQKGHKNKLLATLTKIKSKYLTHSLCIMLMLCNSKFQVNFKNSRLTRKKLLPSSNPLFKIWPSVQKANRNTNQRKIIFSLPYIFLRRDRATKFFIKNLDYYFNISKMSGN